jgi:hypothetical protein
MRPFLHLKVNRPSRPHRRRNHQARDPQNGNFTSHPAAPPQSGAQKSGTSKRVLCPNVGSSYSIAPASSRCPSPFGSPRSRLRRPAASVLQVPQRPQLHLCHLPPQILLPRLHQQATQRRSGRQPVRVMREPGAGPGFTRPAEMSIKLLEIPHHAGTTESGSRSGFRSPVSTVVTSSRAPLISSTSDKFQLWKTPGRMARRAGGTGDSH